MKVELKTVLKLVRAHADHDEITWRDTLFALCNDLDKAGEGEIAQYIYAQLGYGNTFSPGGGELPTDTEQTLIDQINELRDATWRSRSDSVTQAEAAKKREERAVKTIRGIFESYSDMKKLQFARRLLAEKTEIEDALGDEVEVVEISTIKKMLKR